MKRVFSLFLILLLCIFLTSCGKKDERVVEGSFVFTEENLPKLCVVTQMQSEGKLLIDTVLGYEYKNQELLSVAENTLDICCDLKNGKVDVAIVTNLDNNEFLNDASLTSSVILADALVFFVSGIEGADLLTSEQIEKIFKGEFTNWSQLGLEDCPITVFDCDEGSLSKNAFDKLVNVDTSALPPVTSTVMTENGKFQTEVEFDARKGAIGFTTYSNCSNVWHIISKSSNLIAVDGVKPDENTIQQERYRFVWSYSVVTKKDDTSGLASKILYNWITSSQGREVLQSSKCIVMPLVVSAIQQQK